METRGKVITCRGNLVHMIRCVNIYIKLKLKMLMSEQRLWHGELEKI